MDIHLPYEIGTKVYVVAKSDDVKNTCNTCRGSGSTSWEDDYGGYRSSNCNNCYGSGEVKTPKGTKPPYIVLDTPYTIDYFVVKSGSGLSKPKILVVLKPGGHTVSSFNIFKEESEAIKYCNTLNSEINQLHQRLKELTE